MEFIFFLISTFLVGIFIGSFLHVLVDRIPRGESFSRGRSHCDHCRHTLAWFDLIPVFSWLQLGGKCRYCKKQISAYHPLVEVTTGIIFVIFTWVLAHSFVLFSPFFLFAYAYFLFLFSAFIVIFFTDLKYGIIPFKVVSFGVIVALLWYLLPLILPPLAQMAQQHYFLNAFLSGLGAFAAFFLLFLATRGRGLGFGDVVFVFLMGFALGFPRIILGMYIAFISGAIISVILVWIGRKKLKGETIPFGPFLVAGTVISLLWGDYLIAAIMSFLMR